MPLLVIYSDAIREKKLSSPRKDFFKRPKAATGRDWLPVIQAGTLLTKQANPRLQDRLPSGNPSCMKRVYLSLMVILVLIGAMYAWNHRHDLKFLSQWLPSGPAEGIIQPPSTAQLEWRPVEDTSIGFKVEMPGDPKRVVVQATSETGGNEPISMLLVKPDSGRTYAIAWAEKPPVARINDLVPDKTLDQARDGALNRTQTTLVSEIRSNPQGYPGRDVVAHNVGGGILDTRFIYASPRLYMLIATAPSSAARHEQDVIHFFNSFAIATNTQIPETLPASTQ